MRCLKKVTDYQFGAGIYYMEGLKAFQILQSTWRKRLNKSPRCNSVINKKKKACSIGLLKLD